MIKLYDIYTLKGKQEVYGCYACVGNTAKRIFTIGKYTLYKDISQYKLVKQYY